MKEKVVLMWTGGKDGIITLNELIQSGKYQVVALLAGVNESRGLQHWIRISLLEKQAQALGIPLLKVVVPQDVKSSNISMEQVVKVGYDKTLQMFSELRKTGVSYIAGGYIVDVERAVAERKLAEIGLKPLMPLAGRKTIDVAHEFIDSGFKAIVVKTHEKSTWTKDVGINLLGREYNLDFINSIPGYIDPAGEFYEFHTFVYAGPLFRNEIAFKKGEILYVDEKNWGISACLDLLPV